MPITLEQYFAKPHTAEQRAAALDLLRRRAALRAEYYAATGRTGPDIDPDTGNEISGSRGGNGDGGFRVPTSDGAKNSAHKEARAVDDYDPKNDFDDWLTLFDKEDGRYNEKLEKNGLYREHPSTTPTWCHLTTRAPASGKRTFYP
jgi:hypothetical protein